LEEAIELLRQRLIKKEKQKCDLITLFKKIVTENQLKLESLQKENKYLQNTIQEQNQMIEDYLNMSNFYSNFYFSFIKNNLLTLFVLKKYI
jgi:predicted RNase H-like nuclease (RuvC/YqgF family)